MRKFFEVSAPDLTDLFPRGVFHDATFNYTLLNNGFYTAK